MPKKTLTIGSQAPTVNKIITKKTTMRKKKRHLITENKDYEKKTTKEKKTADKTKRKTMNRR